MLFKPTSHQKIPQDAKIIQKEGKAYARFKRLGKVQDFEIVKEGTCKVETEHWYARLKMKNGKKKRVPLGVKDKMAAQTIALKMQTDLDRGKASLPKLRTTNTIEHWLEKYVEQIQDPKYGQRVKRLVLRISKKLKWKNLDDMEREGLESHLSDRLKAGCRFSTRNFDAHVMKGFATWLHKNDIWESPFSQVKIINKAHDPGKRERRVWTEEEFGRIVNHAQQDKGRAQGIRGEERALIYLTAASTGLRKNELACLNVGDIVWKPSPSLRLRSYHSKAKRRDEYLPIHPDLAERLRTYLGDRKQGPLFNLRTKSGDVRHVERMLRRDCKAVGVEYKTDEGVADFHSIRAQFITALCRSCSDFSVVVSLARHADPRLTAKIYDKVRDEDRRGAVSGLKLPG